MQASVEDVEDVVSAGREQKACPYYASRHAIPLAEVRNRPQLAISEALLSEELSVLEKN